TMFLGLTVHGGVELRLRDLRVLDQDVAQAIAPVDDRRVADPALVEVDVAEVRAVGDRETPRLLPQREQLEHVGERRFLERSLDGHQRNSSITRSATSSTSAGSGLAFCCPSRRSSTDRLTSRSGSVICATRPPASRDAMRSSRPGSACGGAGAVKTSWRSLSCNRLNKLNSSSCV